MVNNEILILQNWTLKNNYLNFNKGKICKVHSTGNTIEAYWLSDIWNPIMLSKKEFLKNFKLSN
jgi:hypothetical protein|tara:strand:- start:1088 stop:1279 length:192 start_codon:yes stop_codon:yes gene_type:complete